MENQERKQGGQTIYVNGLPTQAASEASHQSAPSPYMVNIQGGAHQQMHMVHNGHFVHGGHQVIHGSHGVSQPQFHQQQHYYPQYYPQQLGSQHVNGQQTTVSQQTTVTGDGGRLVSGMTETSRVVRRETGEHRLVSVTERVDESQVQIVGERYVHHEVKVPKRIVREEIVEKVIIVPEKIMTEEIVDESHYVKEKVIEIARPTIVEKVIEIPEYEYVEKLVEVPEKIYQERVKEVEKVHYQDRIKEVEKVILQERVVEVPDVQYRDVPVERVVEVPEWREEIILKEVPVPQYVDKPIEQVVQKEVMVDVNRTVPVPVEANLVYEFRVPRIKPRYHKVTYPVYLPRFIEIPVAMELLRGGLLSQTEAYLQQVNMLTQTAASLCEIENLATSVMRSDIHSKVSHADLQSAVLAAWNNGTLGTTNHPSMHTTHSASHIVGGTGMHGNVGSANVASGPVAGANSILPGTTSHHILS